jgi:hypothetical protein
MGNRYSCVNPPSQVRQPYRQPYRPPAPIPAPVQQRQVVDKNAFYHRELVASSQQYFEHDKYRWLVKEWDVVVNRYNNETDCQLKDAINQNMHILIDDHNFSLVRRYISVQMTAALIPVQYKYIYKLARVLTDGGKVLHTVAALVTMRLDIHKAKIADSYTGSLLKYDMLKENKEYCCDKAEVYAFKIIGEKENVMEVTPDILDSTYKIVSNFDIKFEYTIGHHITEPGFGTRGTGCYQGIHFFTNMEAAVKYTEKGMINMIEGLPHVTKSIIPEEADHRVVGYGVIYNEGWNISNKTVRVYDTAEAMLRYYNSLTSSDSYRGLKQVCGQMYGDWYLHNNFGVEKRENIKIEHIHDDDDIVVATTVTVPDEEKVNPPPYNLDVASVAVIPDKVKVESHKPIIPTTTTVPDNPPPYEYNEEDVDIDIGEEEIDIEEHVSSIKPYVSSIAL